jgi:hypothetical protein
VTRAADAGRSELEPLRYPLGRFKVDVRATDEKRRAWIDELAVFPETVRAAVAGLSDEQLDTPYRPDGWTVRQVVHHLPDSHTSAYVRFKLALTEDEPMVKTFEQDRWAELADAKAPVEVSIGLLEALHRRWVILLRSLDAKQFARAFQHPEWGRTTLDTALQMYAWHGRHHVAHITGLRERKGWT